MAFEGSCLCGAVRYGIHRRHLKAMHCYCAMCRKAHGTAFSTHAVARPEQIEWLSGHDGLRAFESSPGAVRAFCPTCGTHMLVHGQTGDGTHAIPAGTLEGDPALTILGHMFTEDEVSWVRLDDDLPRYGGWPPGFGPAAGGPS